MKWNKVSEKEIPFGEYQCCKCSERETESEDKNS